MEPFQQDEQDGINPNSVLLQELVEFLEYHNIQLFMAFQHPHITKGAWSLFASRDAEESGYWIKEYHHYYNIKQEQQPDPFKRKCNSIIQDTSKHLHTEERQWEADIKQETEASATEQLQKADAE
jgi:hypothetical protein